MVAERTAEAYFVFFIFDRMFQWVSKRLYSAQNGDFKRWDVVGWLF